MPFDRKRVAADQQRAEPVVDGSFDYGRRVERLAQSHDAFVGVYLGPDDHGLLSHPDRLYLRNLHGCALFQASRNSTGHFTGDVFSYTMEAAVMLLDGRCRYGLVVSSLTPSVCTRYIGLRYNS